MSKVIYVCKTEEEFEELCSVFKFKRDFNFFTWEDLCLRVVDGEVIDWGLESWYLESGIFTDHRVTRYHKGMLEEAIDDVKSPKHYELEGLEPYQSIDIINAIVRRIDDPVRAFRVGNALKYLIRAEKKNGLEDYKKARVYLDWIIKEMEE